jgi:phosphinothricin acetyltransferase
MSARISRIVEYAPWLVCEIDGRIVGYAYGSHFRERAAYDWSLELGIGVHVGFRRRGVGKALLVSVMACMKTLGFREAFGAIALPNLGSIGLAESVGARSIGVQKRVGYKLGKWRDVGWWQFDMGNSLEPPEPARKPADIAASPEWIAALASGLTHIAVP